jgi:beta-galactosidase
MKIRTAMLVLGLFPSLLRPAVLCAQPENLARNAVVSFHSGSGGTSAQVTDPQDRANPAHLNDGDTDTEWRLSSAPGQGASLVLSWPRVVTFREVLIRQGERSKLQRVSVEVRRDGKWEPIKALRGGADPLPAVILLSGAAYSADALRLTAFDGVPHIAEIEVYEGPNPPVIELAGDARGRIIGVLTDAWGAEPLSGISISLAGKSGRGRWKAAAVTDVNGHFSAAAPAGLDGLLQATAHVGAERISKQVDASDLPLALTPSDDFEEARSLNGPWRFAVDPPEDFFRAEFDDAGWNTIPVPAHWEMHGNRPRSGIAGYRRTVSIPPAWRNRRIKIRFDGVYSGAAVWLNGQRLGAHEGGFTPFEVDATEAAREGENLLAVRVRAESRASALDNMSLYANFGLGGIMRGVTLFSVPHVHLERFHVTPSFDSGFRNATLTVDAKLVNASRLGLASGELRWELKGPDGVPVSASFRPMSFSLHPWEHQERTITLPVQNPLHWEAEHPRLYRLAARVFVGGREIERVSRPVGFRQVEVRGTRILVNGVPIKLRGTCHHDAHPLMGRAVTPELTRQDLELIQAANLNALRTSHYPAIPELYDYADEMGLYVEDEAPFCWVGQSHDLRLAPLVTQLTAEMLERDRSHPSVIFWSLANESRWGPVFERSLEHVRRADPSRPVGAATTKDLDIATLHNPLSVARIRENSNLKTPLVFDESMCIFQGIWNDTGEMWRDPGYRDYWVSPLIAVWEELLASEVTQGSMIWAWSDDLFSVPARGSEHGRGATRMHDVDRSYRLPGRGVVGDAPWGVVDGWRRLKPEYWHVKKLHSPIRVLSLALPIPAPGEPVRLTVQNRYEFTNLSELTLRWQLGKRQGELHPDLPPQQRGQVEIAVEGTSSPGSELLLQFLTRDGRIVDEEIVRLGESAEPEDPKRQYSDLTLREEKMLAGRFLTIAGGNFEIAFDKDEGSVKRLVAYGEQILYETPKLHILPMDATLSEIPNPWTWKLSHPLGVVREGGDLVVTARGSYREAEGQLQYRISPSGELQVRYDFTYTGPEITAREVGLRFAVPPYFDTLQWERRGEWTTYPENHIGRNAGSARAYAGNAPQVPPVGPYALDDSPMGTNDFRSTKRHIGRAAIASAEGHGVRIDSDGSQHLRASVETDRIAVHVNDWFGGTGAIAWGEWYLNYGKGKLLKPGDRLAGTIRLRLLDRR